MKLASDWFKSKTFWLAVAASIPIVFTCVQERRFPSREEAEILVVAWGIAFGRDAYVKSAEGRLPGQTGGMAQPVDPTAKIISTT